MINLPGLLFGVIAAVVVIIYFNKGSKLKLDRFKDREELSLDTIYDNFFKEKNVNKEVVVCLWNELAGVLELPKGKLRPTDSFDNELAPAKGYEFDDQIAAVPALVKRKFKAAGIEPNLDQIKTIYDYIMILAPIEKINAKRKK